MHSQKSRKRLCPQVVTTKIFQETSSKEHQLTKMNIDCSITVNSLSDQLSSTKENDDSVKKVMSSCSFPSSQCMLDDSHENTSCTVDMILSSSLNNSDDEIPVKFGNQESPNVIPEIVSFESPIRRRGSAGTKHCSSDSFSTASVPDIYHTEVDIDTETSRESTDSDFSQHSTEQGPQQKSEDPSSASASVSSTQCPNEDLELVHKDNFNPVESKGDTLEQYSSPEPTSIESIKRTAANDKHNFTKFRLQYLTVHTAIMLADGLQGKLEKTRPNYAFRLI